MPKRVVILISGGGSNMLRLIQAMQNSDFGAMPVLVITNNPDATGLDKAKKYNIPTAIVDHRKFGANREKFETYLHETICQHSPDIICLAGFMRILSANFIAKWKGKILNIHPSLLPKYKGLRTHQRAIDAGDSHGGCSVHLVTPALDDGPVLSQIAVPIHLHDTADDLAARVLIQEHNLYPKTLREFVNK